MEIRGSVHIVPDKTLLLFLSLSLMDNQHSLTNNAPVVLEQDPCLASDLPSQGPICNSEFLG